TSPVSPWKVLPGVWLNVSQIDGPFPSASGAPSIWYAAVAAPHRNPSGNRSCPSVLIGDTFRQIEINRFRLSGGGRDGRDGRSGNRVRRRGQVQGLAPLAERSLALSAAAAHQFGLDGPQR